MKFICMGLIEESKWDSMTEEECQQAMEQCFAYDDELRRGGHFLRGEALQSAQNAVTLRMKNGAVDVTDGPFAETKEMLGGLLFLEARDLNHAIALMSKHPGVKMGPFEIRPADEQINAMIAARDAAHKERQSSFVQPYLFFAGRCEEALTFYQQALGATVGMMLRFSESPDPVPEGILQEGFEDKIMHASFTVGQTTIMASDGCSDQTKFDGFRLSVSVASEAVADATFNALAEDGNVDMPLTKTFWSPRYGMVTDKFGVGWMVMVPGETESQCGTDQ